MGLSSWRLLLLLLCGGVLVFTAGCKSSEEAERTSSPSSVRGTAPDLAAPSDEVRTIQLYRGEDERQLPVTSLQGEDPLTLEFDLMAKQGRPLSIYFQHADRTWRRDLSASEAMESFQDDNLVEYQSSRGTKIPYVHYTYRFPNDEIQFRVSGNYILRVTERGRRDSVLFEQPFFVTEGEGGVQLGAESFVVPDQRQPSILPVARYSPPAALQGDPFGYTVCFVRNGRFSEGRCDERPRLMDQPELRFELEREQAFSPTTAEYALDLGSLQKTPKIERTDRTTTPTRVLLAPDYARFEDAAPGRTLNGQIVIREALRNRSTPALTAEYVQTTFAFVPSDEQPYSEEVSVVGSFSGMNSSRGTSMEWVEARGRYEGEVLLKQGLYQYFYTTSDPVLEREVRRTRPRTSSTYMAFVYYEDSSRNTDRLLQVRSISR